ncbi:hypothetical protein [Roseovarius sp. MMSF_3305]|uniref:hypothetical protein n=1 Tax=Roseovarius sp. MMSF_3305 TaxID=3046697 RepID=UPI00273D277D|nr:hypothetical protein [Roseovarius sp. MMSF_3305]
MSDTNSMTQGDIDKDALSKRAGGRFDAVTNGVAREVLPVLNDTPCRHKVARCFGKGPSNGSVSGGLT